MIERVISEDGQEPITLSLAKQILNVTHKLKDEEINGLISTARALCETCSRHTILDRTRLIRMPLPVQTTDELNVLTTVQDPFGISKSMRLPYPPVTKINSIELVKHNGTTTPFTDYNFDEMLGTVYWDLADSSVVISDHKYIQVNYSTGWGDNDVPADIKGAIREVLIALWDEGGNLDGLPKKAIELLMPYQHQQSYVIG